MSYVVYSSSRLFLGILYPAYTSYKAIKTKNIKEYVKWMMYWIVFALFTCVETFTDIFLAFWFPFYYELKVIFVLWLLSPTTRGASILYRKLIHPQLSKNEAEIDQCLNRAKQQGYSAMVQLGSRGFSFATTFVMQTALKGQATLVGHLKKSYSLNDLEEEEGSHPNYPPGVDKREKSIKSEPEEAQHHYKWLSEDTLTDSTRKRHVPESQHLCSTGSLRRTHSVPKPPLPKRYYTKSSTIPLTCVRNLEDNSNLLGLPKSSPSKRKHAKVKKKALDPDKHTKEFSV